LVLLKKIKKGISILIFKDKLTLLNIIGFLVCLSGILIYKIDRIINFKNDFDKNFESYNEEERDKLMNDLDEFDNVQFDDDLSTIDLIKFNNEDLKTDDLYKDINDEFNNEFFSSNNIGENNIVSENQIVEVKSGNDDLKNNLKNDEITKNDEMTKNNEIIKIE
jgi:hypothetical protein